MSLREPFAVAAGFLAPFLLALALVPARTSLTHTNLALLLVVAVVAVSALGNRSAGALAALSAAAWFDFFHTEPYQSFHIQGRADIETAVLLLAVGLVVSQLAAHARLLGRAALADATHLERLHTVIRLARGGPPPERLVRLVERELTEVLELRSCRFVPGDPASGAPGGRLPRLEPDGTVQVADWIWDLDRQGWPPETEIALAAEAHGSRPGHFLLTPVPESAPPPLEARLVAADLAAQAAAALEPGGRPAVRA
ncbi:DUF4118 domain-containing protein [Streptomyces physcomitrii]|nr:DUF4118 domain-containing protein [Streptomyces physcomitrii]